MGKRERKEQSKQAKQDMRDVQDVQDTKNSAYYSHDKLFKKVEQVKENAADFIETIFPPEITAKLDLNTLETDNTNYVDKSLSEHFSDLVYNCNFGEDKDKIKIALLFEHKSKPDDFIHLQLLRYMLLIWRRQRKNNEPLTPIIPTVFYHGEKKWKQVKMAELFNTADPLLMRFLPSFDYILADLHDYDDESIRHKLFKRDMNKAIMLLFKHTFREDELLEHLELIFTLLKNRFGETQDKGFIEAFFRYLFNRISIVYKDRIINTLERILPDEKEVGMTIAVKLREEGLKEGLQKGLQKGKLEGLQEGKLETAQRMILKGFDLTVISDVTGLSVNKLREIKNSIR